MCSVDNVKCIQQGEMRGEQHMCTRGAVCRRVGGGRIDRGTYAGRGYSHDGTGSAG